MPARAVFDRLSAAGIGLDIGFDEVYRALEDEGAEKFTQSRWASSTRCGTVWRTRRDEMVRASRAITDRLSELLDEEHDLRTRALRHGGGLLPEEQTRLNELEQDLNQVMRLLEQRRALAVFDHTDEDPATR